MSKDQESAPGTAPPGEKRVGQSIFQFSCTSLLDHESRDSADEPAVEPFYPVTFTEDVSALRSKSREANGV